MGNFLSAVGTYALHGGPVEDPAARTQKRDSMRIRDLNRKDRRYAIFERPPKRPGRLPTMKGGESACKPGSVESSHSSGTCVTAGLKRPTRKHVRARAAVF